MNWNPFRKAPPSLPDTGNEHPYIRPDRALIRATARKMREGMGLPEMEALK